MATAEPVLIGTAVEGVAVAVMAVLTGAEIVDPILAGGLLAVVAALIVLVGSITRSKVTPVANDGGAFPPPQ